MLETAPIVMKAWMGIYEWERMNSCPSCSNHSLRDYERYRNGLLEIVLEQCDSCGLVVQNPRLSESSLNKYYSNEYRRRLRKQTNSSHSQNLFERGMRRGTYIGKFLDESGIAYKGKRVFEFGCAYGGILEYFRDQGCMVTGCDIDHHAIQYGQSRGLNIQAGGEEVLDNIEEKVSMVILSHVLEHMLRPFVFLKKVQDILTPEGYVYVEVPGIDDEKRKTKRNAQLGHLMYFNLKTLRALLEKAGFHFVCGNEIVQSCSRRCP